MSFSRDWRQEFGQIGAQVDDGLVVRADGCDTDEEGLVLVLCCLLEVGKTSVACVEPDIHEHDAERAHDAGLTNAVGTVHIRLLNRRTAIGRVTGIVEDVCKRIQKDL